MGGSFLDQQARIGLSVHLGERQLLVDDKGEDGLGEMIRVTKPGGYVGLNEGFLLTGTPSPRVIGLARRIGIAMVTLGTWRALWEASVGGREPGRPARSRHANRRHARAKAVREQEGNGGDEGTRTPDPRDANAVLSQLSYIPTENRPQARAPSGRMGV